ncbi:MAG: transporter substrate-binding domain-containing protein, partial [Chloroflexota bacterium]
MVILVCIGALLLAALLYLLLGEQGRPARPAQATASLSSRPAGTPAPSAIAPADLNDPAWQRARAAGKLSVGISADYPPFAYVDTDFTVKGYDVALVQELGRRLGLPVDVKLLAFDGLSDALALGQIDLAVAAISVTAERAQHMDFSRVYFVSQDAVLARQGSPLQVAQWRDLAG